MGRRLAREGRRAPVTSDIPVPTEKGRELIITSGIIVQPGDKVLLVMPDHVNPDEVARFKAHLDAWAPEADWLLVAGPEAVYQRKGDPDA